ncbi:MAG: cysteinyl-tRNA synthetase [Chloroflexi bacterium]|nr:cysteinyl-tRNA synthetase [Chloroflexota bacterium]
MSGARVFEALARSLSAPLDVSFVETPAGFELNSAEVVGRVARFARSRLHNYHPRVTVIPARRRGTAFSPDDAQVEAPLLHSNLIFLGPGSPTYAVRQLQGSLTWHFIIARHRLGAALALASAATIAAGTFALPVYEIYKVGEDPHWKPGLDLLAPFGLRLAFVPHWDNAEGGAGLDTSRCFMGRERFRAMAALLPRDVRVVGVDEHTGLLIEPGSRSCRVLGRGGVTLQCGADEWRLESGTSFEINKLGAFRLPEASEGIPPEVWTMALDQERDVRSPGTPNAQVMTLVEQRLGARARKDWALADQLRAQIASMGWIVVDTAEGSRLEPASKA